jgi:hypothetical protein
MNGRLIVMMQPRVLRFYCEKRFRRHNTLRGLLVPAGRVDACVIATRPRRRHAHAAPLHRGGVRDAYGM